MPPEASEGQGGSQSLVLTVPLCEAVFQAAAAAGSTPSAIVHDALAAAFEGAWTASARAGADRERERIERLTFRPIEIEGIEARRAALQSRGLDVDIAAIVAAIVEEYLERFYFRTGSPVTDRES